MALRRCLPLSVTPWSAAVQMLPQQQRVNHAPDQYGLECNAHPAHQGTEGPTRGLTPPSDEPVYHPIQEPFLVPPKWRAHYNFTTGHGKYLYSKDPLWVEARERFWDDQQMAAQVHRANYEHLRKQYRKQYQEAHRYNIDEYLTTINRLKLVEEAEREASERQREKGLDEDLARIDAIEKLKEKRRQLTIEMRQRRYTWVFERVSEELQYITERKLKEDYYTPENLDDKLSSEVTRWVRGTKQLNSFGRIPVEENPDATPKLDAQMTYSTEDYEDGQTAFQRLMSLQQGYGAKKTKTEGTYVSFDFDAEGGAQLDPSNVDDGAPEVHEPFHGASAHQSYDD